MNKKIKINYILYNNNNSNNSNKKLHKIINI